MCLHFMAREIWCPRPPHFDIGASVFRFQGTLMLDREPNLLNAVIQATKVPGAI